VPRLSIVIPLLGDSGALERTLVSVLENRPPACEVIVVLNGEYADPYQLKDELLFVEAPRGAGLAQSARLGIQASAAPIVHVLASGVEVVERWTDAVMPHFADPAVAAVAPTVMDAQRRDRIVATAVRYRAGGGRALETDYRRTSSKKAVVGPVGIAAFYRKAVLELVEQALPATLGEDVADVELALTLKHIGLRCVFEPQSQVYARLEQSQRSRGFRAALSAERLFWRSAPAVGWTAALASHPFVVLGELARSVPRPAAITQLTARLLGCCTIGSHARHHRRLNELKAHVEASLQEKAKPQLRIDDAHRGRQASDASDNRLRRAG